MIKTTLYLPEELHHKVAAHARREKRSQAEVLREAIERYLDRPADLPGFIGIADDDSVSASESEDWIRKNWPKTSSHDHP